ncbi:hypothetical protein LNP74_00310 [Klebsiella pneumoniae subsp. pneumoniae]|nr:hypothetical protein [Klebsiella pneumoniae subsp. pneumoniae]
MVSDLRQGEDMDRRYLPLPGITLQNIGNPQKPFRICPLMLPPNFNTRGWFLPP